MLIASCPVDVFRVEFPYFSADVAQLVEQRFRKPWAGGSSPLIGTSSTPETLYRLKIIKIQQACSHIPKTLANLPVFFLARYDPKQSHSVAEARE